MASYKSAFEAVADVLTCSQCKNLFSEPVVMDCGHSFCLICAGDLLPEEGGCCRCPVCRVKLRPGMHVHNHQLGKAALVAKVMKKVMAQESSAAPRVTSDRDSGVWSAGPPSEISSVSAYSRGSMYPPPNMASDKGFPNNLTLSSRSSASPCSVASVEPPTSMAEVGTRRDVSVQRGRSERRQNHFSSNSSLANKANRSHPYVVRPDRLQSPTFSDMLKFSNDFSTYAEILNEDDPAWQYVPNNSVSVQTPEHPAPTETAGSPSSGPEGDAVVMDGPMVPESPCISNTDGYTRLKPSEPTETEPS